ncbi:cytochrome P450 [Melittangium boletus]|uniref:cytochrome P450 n=1 Tax=Melittangium boletus TaxID=83453 RepID=UPI003DA63078
MTQAPLLQVPTAPARLPLLGHSLPLLNRSREFLCSLAEVGGLVRVYIGQMPLVVITDAELTRQMLNDSTTFDKGGGLYEKLSELTGAGLLTSQSELHKRQRRLIQPAFNRNALKAYSAGMADVVEEALRGWEDGLRVDIKAAAYHIVSRISARSMFSAEMDDASIARVSEALSVYLNGLFVRTVGPGLIFDVLPIPGNLRYKKSIAILHEEIRKIIDAYVNTGVEREDVLSMLLKEKDEEEKAGLSPREVHNQVTTLLLAGIETSAATLCWALYLLSLHPDITRRLHAEVDSVLQGRNAQWDDIPHLKETRRIVMETLRLYPPGWIFTRVTMRETVLGGYLLPQGTGIAYSPYLLHRNPSAFPQPDLFDPDRWLPERSKDLAMSNFVPFGGGARRCIGEMLGLTEVMLTLATIASKWEVRDVENGPVEPAPAHVSLTPKHLRMRVTRRS